MTLRDRDVCVAAELADAHDLLDLVHSHELEPADPHGNPISPR